MVTGNGFLISTKKTGRQEINVYAGSYLYDIKGQQPADYKTNIWIQ
jgi:hypothetical protein